MRIHNLCVDEQGETHFRDIEVEWIAEGRAGRLLRGCRRRGLFSGDAGEL